MLQYFYVNSLTQQFKLCHPQFTQSEYYIPPPHPCVRHHQETIHKFSAKIFNPSDTLIQVPVHVCQLYTTTWTTTSAVALQLRASPKVSARAPAHRSYHFRGVKLKSCIKKIHHNFYISIQNNVRIKHADTEGSTQKKFGTDARVQ